MLQIERQWIKPYTNLDYIVQKASKAHCVAVYHVHIFFKKSKTKLNFSTIKGMGSFENTLVIYIENNSFIKDCEYE